MFEIGTAVIIASAFNLSIRLVVHEDQVIESLNFEILFSCDIRTQGHQRFTPEYVIKNQTKPHLRNYSFLHSHFLTPSQTKLLIP